MTNIYVLLNDSLSSEQGMALTGAVADAGGRIAVAVSPRLLIVDGDASTTSAVEDLVGDGVVAVGEDDVSPLVGPAADSVDLAAQVDMLADTTSAAQADADAVRTREGETWRGFGCLPQQA